MVGNMIKWTYMAAQVGTIPWNKGKTKFELPGLLKIAEKRRQKNNFLNWYKENPVHYAKLKHSVNLAELYGTMLGDGCIEKFPRTEKLSIAFNSKETDHIAYIVKLVRRLFRKNPTVIKMHDANCIKITLYQKDISKRLKFPTGFKAEHRLIIPAWIKGDRKYLIGCLKGLFETDGDWVIDKKYGTNVIKFTNVIDSLLDDLHQCLIRLGFPANRGKQRVTISRIKEVEKFVKLIKFRQYN